MITPCARAERSTTTAAVRNAEIKRVGSAISPQSSKDVSVPDGFEPDIRVRFGAVDGDSNVIIEMAYGVGLGDFEDCRWRVEGMMIVFVGRSDSLLPSATERHSGQPLTRL